MKVDPAGDLLQAYLGAQSETEVDLHLTRILDEYAKPIIQRIVTSVIRSSAATREAEDIVSDTVAQLLRRLRELRDDPSQPIQDLRGYVAKAAYNSCHERLREKYPGRNRLRNHLRYFLGHHADLSLWRASDMRMVCGRRAWSGRPTLPSDWWRAWNLPARHDPSAENRLQIQALAVSLIEKAGAPVELDSLITAIGRLIQLDEQRVEIPLTESEQTEAISAELQLDLRHSLRHLWNDIGQLPRKQRAALLLNLRDAHGREIISLFPHTRTATIAEIAAAVQIPALEFAVLWGELPLDDEKIGKLLGATRQQVIKLRRLARERLRRMVKAREETVSQRRKENSATESPSSGKSARVTSRVGRKVR